MINFITAGCVMQAAKRRPPWKVWCGRLLRRLRSFWMLAAALANLARGLIAEGMSPDLMTLLDPSAAMLARCADIPIPKIQGRLESLPFEDGAFDLVTCAWALETVPDPHLALVELCRVVRAGGALCLAFCADEPARGLTDSLMRQALLYRGTGRFLSRSQLMQAIETLGDFEVRAFPSHGPASTLLARRSGAKNLGVLVAERRIEDDTH